MFSNLFWGIEGNTVDTTRINAGDPFTLAVYNSRLIYPSPHVHWHPKGAVIAANSSYHYAMAGASLIHHPSTSTHLLTSPGFLPLQTAQELIRLKLSGENLPAQVFLIGPVSNMVKQALLNLGLSYINLGATTNVYQAAAEIAEYRLDVIPPMGETGKQNVIITSGETFFDGLPAPAFAAHMGTPILFVSKNSIPGPTEAFIRQHSHLNYFILGTMDSISHNVVSAINGLTRGIVERIPGNDPYEISVNFARYHKPEAADFGWNRNKPQMGDAFNFAPVHRWENAVMSALQGHEGKHAPELTIRSEKLPMVTKSYLKFLRPRKEKPMPPFMHGFIQGNFFDIHFSTQIEIEEAIIFEELGMMH